MRSPISAITLASTPADIVEARLLFVEYAASLGFAMSAALPTAPAAPVVCYPRSPMAKKQRPAWFSMLPGGLAREWIDPTLERPT